MHSSVANGQMQEFGVGDYEPSFENAVFSLQTNNISKPFLTTHGYHIVKLTGKTQPIKKTDARAMEILRGKVEQSDRMVATKMVLAQKILKEAGFKKALFNEADLWMYSDSLLNYQKMSRPVSINASSTLFQFGGKNINAADWIGYSQTFRYKPDGSGIKPYPVLWEEFVQTTALNYYQENLEKYSEEFREQISEFKEGNLFFEIMQREVWGPAQSDSAALADYFEKNREKYTWKESADAVIFYSNDMAVAKTFLSELRSSPNQWQDLASKYEEIISADSSRFELDQIPNGTKKALTAGTITEPVVNKADNTVSFAWLIRSHNRPEPRSFDDARGLVITDYQAALEKEWVEQLKRKYPVRINDKALHTLIKEKKY